MLHIFTKSWIVRGIMNTSDHFQSKLSPFDNFTRKLMCSDWYPKSGVVLDYIDYIDSWSLPSFLLSRLHVQTKNGKLYVQGEVNKFVECGIFLYNSRFVSFLCSEDLCQLQDNSRSVNNVFRSTYNLFEANTQK